MTELVFPSSRRGTKPPEGFGPRAFAFLLLFRRRRLAALAALFVQMLKLCERAELVKLGHVAIDGTKTPPAQSDLPWSDWLFNLHPNLGAIIVFDLNAELLNLLAAPL